MKYLRYAFQRIVFKSKINRKCFKLFILKNFVMKYQSMNRPQWSRGKTPRGCCTADYLPPDHQPVIRTWITEYADVMLVQIITLLKQSLAKRQIGVKKFLKLLLSLSRLMMHPLNLRTKYCSSICKPFFIFPNETAKNLQILGLMSFLSPSTSSK